MPIADKEMHGYFCGLFSGMKGEPGYKYWKKKYQTNAMVPLSKQETLRLQVGISHHKPYVRFDFNPANLGAAEWEQTHMHLGYMLEYGYASLLAESHVSYLEIAVDCTGVEMKSLLPFDSQVRNSGWYPDFTDPSPTCYLGRRGSNRVIRVYDRVARLKAANKQVASEPLTRVEAVLRKLNCGVKELSLIKNPFSSFGVCKLANIANQWSDASWCQFLKHTKAIGVPEALQLAGPKRKPFLHRLKQSNCAWWDSAAVWKLYPEALEVIAPTQLN